MQTALTIYNIPGKVVRLVNTSLHVNAGKYGFSTDLHRDAFCETGI